MEFLKRTFAYGLDSSQNKPLYDRIAYDTSVDVRIVYKIAHGRKIKTTQEREARSELLRAGILWMR